MKRILSLSCLFLLVCLFCLFSCKDMDNIYKDLIVPNGITYPQKVNSVKIYPGLNTVKITWEKGNDPKVVKARIYWNNYSDSLEVAIPANQDLIAVEINDLSENIYTFQIKTFDTEGNISIPVEISGRAFGENYINAISARGVNNVSTQGDGVITINWNEADIANGALYTDVNYIDLNGQEKTVRTLATESFTYLTDYGSQLRHQTAYMPDSLAVAPFPITTEYQEEKSYFVYEKTRWSVFAFSSLLNGFPATNTINGNTGDRWITANAAWPYFITLDLGGVANLARFAVWPSVNGVPAGTIDRRFPTKVKIEVSLDHENWIDLGEYDSDNSLNVLGPRFFDVTPTAARYYRFTGLETDYFDEGNYMILGELDVYCK